MAHAFHPSILREYDIRGIVGETLDEDDAYILGRGFGSSVIRAGGSSICVGFDGRPTSPPLADALMKGLAGCGLEVLNIGLGPTPMLYFAVHHLNAGGGIVVTGSHNPPEYNGFKLVLGQQSFFGRDIQMLGEAARAGDFVSGAGKITSLRIQDDYVERLLKGFHEIVPDGCNLRIAWDPANGAAGPVICDLVKRLPGEHILLNETVDGAFPAHVPDPTVPEALEQLQQTVKKHGLDIGFSFDGDGDRVGAIDERGRIVWGDQILALLAESVLKDNPGATIIADVKSSDNLFKKIKAEGGVPLMWRTGHSLIKKKMVETGALLAGEMSGHIFIADRYYGFDDAIFASLRVLGALVQGEVSLKDWLDQQPETFNTPEIRFPCPEEQKFAAVERLKKLLAKSDLEVNYIDGVRVTASGGWWLLRASNTQAVLVARCEADSAQNLEKVKQHMQDWLDKAGIETAPKQAVKGAAA